MKKLILPVLIIALAVGGVWYYKRGNETPVDTTVANHKNSISGVSFTYPKILTVTSNSGETVVHHEVPFVHHDYCDFKGEGDTTIPTLTDFHLVFHAVNKNLVDTMKAESPYIPQENFVNGEVVASPGFIDEYNVGDLRGFAIFEGAEGCGQTTYYFSVQNNKTLVVREALITVFTGAIDAENQAAAEAVPGVINRAKSIELLQAIFETVRVQ